VNSRAVVYRGTVRCSDPRLPYQPRLVACSAFLNRRDIPLKIRPWRTDHLALTWFNNEQPIADIAHSFRTPRVIPRYQRGSATVHLMVYCVTPLYRRMATILKL